MAVGVADIINAVGFRQAVGHAPRSARPGLDLQIMQLAGAAMALDRAPCRKLSNRLLDDTAVNARIRQDPAAERNHAIMAKHPAKPNRDYIAGIESIKSSHR